MVVSPILLFSDYLFTFSSYLCWQIKLRIFKKRMITPRYIVVLLFALLGSYAQSQISFGGLPTSLTTHNLRSSNVVPTIDITADYTQEREENQFAYQTVTDISFTKEASSVVYGENIIYRLIIHSDEAKSINLIFSPISLPDGARMFLSRPDGFEIYGAYTKESLAGDVFATTPVSGDKILIQCEVPIDMADQFDATISSVNSGFRSLRLLPALGKATDCEEDAVCDDYGLEKQRRAACLIIINGMRFCTGSLIAVNENNRESFVLTSSHCLWDNSGNIDTLYAKRSIFYFGYESPICDAGIVGTYEKSVSSSQIIRVNQEKDMALLKLSKRPPVDYMTYESGWNKSISPRGPLVCIHHPNGDLKKINFSEDDPMPSSFEEDYFTPDSHWKIRQWKSGVTERGSSGSPLYDSEGLIIGALSGGESTCASQGNDDFWRLYKTWDGDKNEIKNLGSALDPTRSGITRLDGRETYDDPCVLLKNFDKGDDLNEPYYSGDYATGHNGFGLDEFAEKFESPYEHTFIHGVSFVPITGTYDEKTPVYLRIYSGDDVPETLVHESVVKITHAEYSSKVSGFITSTINNWSYKENYVRLDSAVVVGKRFFVSFATNYEKSDFAMLANYSERKSSLFKRNGVWSTWENHPFDNSVGGMLVSVVVGELANNSHKDYVSGNNITVYPNPAAENLYINSDEDVVEVRIINSNGSEVMRSHSNKVYIKDLTNGLYTVEIITYNGKCHTKFIKE